MTANNLVDKALTYVGQLTYVMGGDNIANGYGDCSDFTSFIYAQYGYDIGGYTEAQYAKGTSVTRDNIQTGDLVFFKDTYNSGYKDGVSHVGIAINNNEFVHLASSGCKVSSLDSDYYDKHYLGAKSILSDVVNNPVDNVVNDNKKEIDLSLLGDITKILIMIFLFLCGLIFLGLSLGKSVIKGVKNWHSETSS